MRDYKEVWSNHFDRLESENPTATFDELSAMADELLGDEMSSAVDAASDEARDHG